MAASKDKSIGKILAKRFRIESFIADGAGAHVKEGGARYLRYSYEGKRIKIKNS